MSDTKKRCPILDGIGLSTTYQRLRTCGMQCPHRSPSPAVRELVEAAKERDLYKAGFLAAMQWYGCDKDDIERMSVSVSDDIESGMIDKAKGAEEHRQLKAMWNAIAAVEQEGRGA